MTTYKSYAECKIAHPDCEIVTTGKNWAFDEIVRDTFQPLSTHKVGDDCWAVCNPADYCSSLKEFLEAGFKLVEGDKYIETSGKIKAIDSYNLSVVNSLWKNDCERYIISVSSLNGGCKIPAKTEQWTIYNNTMPLCELSDEQAAMLFNSWRGGLVVEYVHCESTCLKTGVKTYEWSYPQILNWGEYIIYRIKPKSERELFIEAAMSAGGLRARDGAEDVYGSLFDSGKFKLVIKDGE